MTLSIATILLALLFGSALTIQILVIPQLMARVQDRSTVTRVSNQILKKHHLLAVVALLPAVILLLQTEKQPATITTVLLLFLNLYQRFWIFTKLHLVKQPIGVQDLIQPDNVLREEFNRLQRLVYVLFRLHLLLLFINLIACAL